jgi:Family of unknown function (DUF5313)
MEQDQRRRPDPLRWIWYTSGGGLRPRYPQMARAVVQVAPLGALLFLVLGFGWIIWVALLGGLVMAPLYSTAYFDQSADRRLIKHGYPPGTAQQALRERDTKDPDRNPSTAESRLEAR